MSPPLFEVYGLHLSGVDGAALLPASAEQRPRVDIRHGRSARKAPCLDRQRAVLDLPQGRQLVLQRREDTATYSGPPLSPDELVHPYLGVAASIFGRWYGREVYHAGAFMSGGRAWAVLGGREAGKSSLLAALAARGVPVLADDLVITDGQQAFCGPRVIDLRQPLPGPVVAMTRARHDTRWRMTLPPLPGAVPLGGWIFLHWCPEVKLATVPASALLRRLAARRIRPGLHSDPETLLAFGTRSGWDLGRPADWGRLDQSVDLILETVEAAAQAQGAGAARNSSSPAAEHWSRNSSTSRAAATA